MRFWSTIQCIVFFLAFNGVSAHGNGSLMLEVHQSTLVYRGVEFKTASLRYLAEDGAFDRSSYQYLIVFFADKHPVIIDRIEGHTVTMDLVDLDQSNEHELILRYHAGGNQFQAKVYSIATIGDSVLGVSLVKNSTLSSNYRRIEICHGKLVVENILSSRSMVEIEYYELVSEELILCGEMTETTQIRENESTGTIP